MRVAVFLAALALAGSARAEVVSYTFSGTVVAATPDGLSVGDPASLFLQYDTETPDSTTGLSDRGRYRSLESELIFEAGPVRGRCELVLLLVEDDVISGSEFLGDLFSASSGTCDPTTDILAVHFANDSGTAFETDELLRLESVEFDRVRVNWYGGEYPGEYFELGDFVAADMTPLTVPESAGGFVALLPLALLRRKRARAPATQRSSATSVRSGR